MEAGPSAEGFGPQAGFAKAGAPVGGPLAPLVGFELGRLAVLAARDGAVEPGIASLKTGAQRMAVRFGETGGVLPVPGLGDIPAGLAAQSLDGQLELRLAGERRLQQMLRRAAVIAVVEPGKRVRHGPAWSVR